jgi:dTDP-4-dehydrorhamnose 3,5-epimerase-like enzyme
MNYSFKDVHFNEDDRAQRCLDIFPEIKDQVNISYVNSTNHVVAWHKHNIQTDYWFCIKGSFKVGLSDGKDVIWEYLSDNNTRTLKIPPGIYHGYKALEPNSILMYYLTEKYNPDDEFRAKVGDFGETWNPENK